MKKRIYHILGLLISIAGLLLALKLTYGQYGNKQGEIDEACKISESVDCNKVYEVQQYSMLRIQCDDIKKSCKCKHIQLPESCEDPEASSRLCKIAYPMVCGIADNFTLYETPYLEIPISHLGFLTYIMFILFFLWGIITLDRFRPATILGPFLISIVSLLFSIRMAVISATEIEVFCPYCIGLYATNLLLFVVTLIAIIKYGKDAWIGPWIGPWYYKSYGALQLYIVPIVIFAIILIIAAPINTAIAYDVSSELKLSKETYSINVADSPSIGQNELGIELIVFSDFECGFCRKLDEDLRKLVEEYDNKIKLYYKFYPLDQKCNPIVQRPFHARSCDAAMAACAAYKQNKFWQYSEEIFEKEEKAREELKTWYEENRHRPGLQLSDYTKYKEMLINMAKNFNLDMEQFQKDISGTDCKILLNRDIVEGIKLQLRGTPTLFINGHRVMKGQKRLEPIKNIIEKMLNKEELPYYEK